ncbi:MULTISPECIES: hypothetical protein [Virgibacillus]|nr:MULTISPECIES: hypothetical protein [Virgibacillus]
MFFTTQDSQITVKEHVTSSNVIVKKSQIASFTKMKDNTEKVYAMKNQKEYPSPKLGSVKLSNDSNKVSINLLLEMLDIK